MIDLTFSNDYAGKFRILCRGHQWMDNLDYADARRMVLLMKSFSDREEASPSA